MVAQSAVQLKNMPAVVSITVVMMELLVLDRVRSS
jgi:hypothetical protein